MGHWAESNAEAHAHFKTEKLGLILPLNKEFAKYFFLNLKNTDILMVYNLDTVQKY